MSIADKIRSKIDSDEYHSQEARALLAKQMRAIIAIIDDAISICLSDEKKHIKSESDRDIIREEDRSYFLRKRAAFLNLLLDYDAEAREQIAIMKLEAKLAEKKAKIAEKKKS